MIKLNKSAVGEISNWVHRNARPLDLALWRYYFEQGERESIIKELLYYQNEDGGFGMGIDPDNWNTASTPYNAQIVIKMLRQIGFTDTSHPIYQGILYYLENTEYQKEYGWMFTIPSNNHYPHGVWWDYDEEGNLNQSIGTTASLSGFLLRYAEPDSTIYNKAVDYTKQLIDTLRNTDKLGDMGVIGYLELLEDIEKSKTTEIFDYAFLKEQLPILLREKIQKEKDNFMANPLEFITSPVSRYYEENKDEVEAALDAIITERPIDGVWDIPWEWYNGNKYPREFAISENWWKSAKALEKLLLLKQFKRFEE